MVLRGARLLLAAWPVGHNKASRYLPVSSVSLPLDGIIVPVKMPTKGSTWSGDDVWNVRCSWRRMRLPPPCRGQASAIVGTVELSLYHRRSTTTLVASIPCGIQWYCRYPTGEVSWWTAKTSYAAANYGVHPGVPGRYYNVPSFFVSLSSSSSSKLRFRLAGQQQPCSIVPILLKQLLYHCVVIVATLSWSTV